MKKLICILLCLATLISLAACNIHKTGPDDDKIITTATTTDPYHLKVIREKKLYQEFKSADGTVVYVVDAVIPEIFGGCSQDVAATINKHYSDIYEEALEFAELNIENAAAYMKNLGSEKPWTRKLSYELKFCNKDYLCLVFSDLMPLSSGATVTPICLNLNDGIAHRLAAFYAEGIDALSDYSTECIIDMFIRQAEFDFGPLNEEQRAAVAEAFDENSFYFDDYSIYFVMHKREINPYKGGIYTAEFFWSDFEGELECPIV